MDERQHIAVVDDHDDIRELVGRYLSENGFRVSLLRGASECRQLLARDRADLIVLDIMMPGEDGLSLCRDLYAQRAAPVILLTAMAGEVDRIVGLEIGADDYLVKPFNPRELLARVKAVLRRSGGGGEHPRPVHGGAAQIRFDEHLLDVPTREIIGPDGVSTQLSTAEFRLLVVFLRNPGVVLSREQLMQETAGRPGDALDRTIDNQISRLRRKIEPDPRSPTLIRTQWGDGYVFTGRVLPA
ncbi:MAG TPA: response regulator [Phycisphaerales bacterium]|nr:response regulator [Phycisphaerales bacterium]